MLERIEAQDINMVYLLMVRILKIMLELEKERKERSQIRKKQYRRFNL